MTSLTRACASLALLALFAGGQAMAFTVDDFEPPPGLHYLSEYVVGVGYNPAYPNPGKDVGLLPSDVLGGQRDYDLEWMGGGGLYANATAKVIGAVGSRYLEYANSTEVETKFELLYGGGAELNTEFSPERDIQIRFVSTDHDSQFIVQLWSDENSPDAATVYRVYNLPDGFKGDFPVPLSDFTGINLKDIDKIAMTFGYASTTGPDDPEAQYAADLDMGIGFIGTGEYAIPEPATLTLLGISLVALARRRKR